MIWSYSEYEELGPFIKSLRESELITQRQVSDATGFSIQTISKFENGRGSVHSVSAARITSYILAVADIGPEEFEALYKEFVSLGKRIVIRC